MIKLDRIKISTSSNFIKFYKIEGIEEVTKNDKIISQRYRQQSPYNLYININHTHKEAIIEFSSKILIDRYPEMINEKNIFDCFANLGKLNICQLDVDNIVNNSELLSCDIAEDIIVEKYPNNLELALKICLRASSKNQVQKYTTSGYTLTKAVKTKSLKQRMSIYYKYKELRKYGNKEFLLNCENAESILEYFRNKLRIEANIKTLVQIRESFDVNDNKLMNVLKSQSSPLVKIFDGFLTVPSGDSFAHSMQDLLGYSSMSELKNALLLKACDYDPAIIENVLSIYLAKGTNKSKYRKVLFDCANTQPIHNENFKFVNFLRDQIIQSYSSNN